MSALETDTGSTSSSSPWLRPVVDSRPPAHRFGEPGPIDIDTGPVEHQPSLLDALSEVVQEPTAPPRPRGVRIHSDTVPGAVEPAPGLPEPGGWTAVLGLAIGQVLVGTRPVGQLECWLEPSVLAYLKRDVRARRRERGLTRGGSIRTVSARVASVRVASVRVASVRVASVRVVSVRLQLPTPTVVEAAIHLGIGAESSALAVRLEGYGQRWVCTALARPEPVSDPLTVRDTA